MASLYISKAHIKVLSAGKFARYAYMVWCLTLIAHRDVDDRPKLRLM